MPPLSTLGGGLLLLTMESCVYSILASPVHEPHTWAQLGPLECLDWSMLGHVLPLLSGIDETALMDGLKRCWLPSFGGCWLIHSITHKSFECLWHHATVQEVL